MVKVADVKPAGTWAEGFRIQARGWPSQGPRRHPRESAAPEREGGTVGPLAAAGWGHREVGRRRACSPVSASGQGGVPGRSRPGHCPLTFPVPAKACHLFLLLLLPPPKTGGGAGPPAPAPLPRGARDSPGGARRRTGGSGSARPLCCRGRWPEGPRAQGPHGVWGGAVRRRAGPAHSPPGRETARHLAFSRMCRCSPAGQRRGARPPAGPQREVVSTRPHITCPHTTGFLWAPRTHFS